MPGGGGLVGGDGDLAEDVLEIGEDLVIGETKDDVALAPEVGISILVSRHPGSGLMAFTVGLHDHAPLAATKIRDERPDGELPMELQTLQPAAPQPLPEYLLRLG